MKSLQDQEKVKWILFLFVFIFAINYMHQLIPCNEVDGKCYPRGNYHLFDQGMDRSLQSHVYYMAERVRLCIYVLIVSLLINVKEIRIVFMLQVGYFFDYILFNNNPWFGIISYTYFMGAGLLFITLRKFYQEWSRS